jgi:hypothetical protein
MTSIHAGGITETQFAHDSGETGKIERPRLERLFGEQYSGLEVNKPVARNITGLLFAFIMLRYAVFGVNKIINMRKVSKNI